MKPRVAVTIEGPTGFRTSLALSGTRDIQLCRACIFLDTALPEDSTPDQALTNHLYGGDDRYRLCQEVILGLGGVSMLKALGHAGMRTYYMNEGHSFLC